MATAEMAFGGGLNSSSGGELKLYLRCTGSTLEIPIKAITLRLQLQVIWFTIIPPNEKQTSCARYSTSLNFCESQFLDLTQKEGKDMLLTGTLLEKLPMDNSIISY